MRHAAPVLSGMRYSLPPFFFSSNALPCTHVKRLNCHPTRPLQGKGPESTRGRGHSDDGFTVVHPSSIGRKWRVFSSGEDDKELEASLKEESARENRWTGDINARILRTYLPLAVVLGISMLVDAAYSGDWSRIGAISHEMEVQLQSIVPLVAVGHGICAIGSGMVSARRGESRWPWRALKALGGGFVTLLEVFLMPMPDEK